MNYRSPLEDCTPGNTYNSYYDTNQFSKYNQPHVNFSHPVPYKQPSWGTRAVSPRHRSHIPTFRPTSQDKYGAYANHDNYGAYVP